MKLFTKITLLIGLLAFVPMSAQAIGKGTVKVFQAKGDINLIDSTGKSTPLSRGMQFEDGTKVITGDNSSALLLFSNGAAVNLTANTTFEVTEFLQAEFDPAAGTFMRLTEDPSTSKTELYVEKGTIVGQVKRLQEGSTYNVNTPTASAGIRGTDYTVTVEYNTDPTTGETIATVTIANASGEVVAVVNNAVTDVPANQSVTFTATRSVSDDGIVTFELTPDSESPTTEPISDEVRAIVEEAITEIETADTDTDSPVIPPAPTEPTDDQGETPNEEIDPDVNEPTSPAGEQAVDTAPTN